MWSITVPDVTVSFKGIRQELFIEYYFAIIYKWPENSPAKVEGCIEQFLGEKITEVGVPLIANLLIVD